MLFQSRIPFGIGILVAPLDQEPVLAPGVAGSIAPETHQVPAPFQTLSVEEKRQISPGEIAPGITSRFPGTCIPEHDGPTPILALRNDSLERAVVQRVVLHVYGKPFVCRVEARPPC